MTRLAARGVYELPFIGSDGERYLVAVDHAGRRIVEAKIYPSMSDPGLMTACLRSLLDSADPVRLRILP